MFDGGLLRRSSSALHQDAMCNPCLRPWLLRRGLWATIILAYNVYLGYAIFYFNVYNNSEEKNQCWQWCQGLGFVLVLTGLVYMYLLMMYGFKATTKWRKALKDKYITKIPSPPTKLPKQAQIAITYGFVFISIGVFLAVDTADDRRRLISAAGIVILVILLALLSKHPKEINWRQVTWGLVLQFLFGLLILRWPLGRSVIECIGQKIDRFLAFTNQGSSFVFGYLVTQQMFNVNKLSNSSLAFNVTSEVNAAKAVPSVVVFSALSVIYFFSFIVNILFHYGVIQSLTEKIGFLLRATIGTSTVESMNAASNIFLGQAMAPLLIQPYLPHLTISELHAVLTSGFSTIAGTVMAAYISFGVSPAHLLSASVMSAPAALATAKLLLPETAPKAKESNEEEAGDIEAQRIQIPSADMTRSSSGNLMDAATQGASSAALLVLNITAIVVAFISFIAFLNSVVSFFGGIIGHPEITFEWILGYLFVPVAFIMGIDFSECHAVGRLLGIKSVANEFIAYRELGLLIQSNEEALLSKRAAIITTYALCGFANPGSIGVQIATLGSLCPERKGDVGRVIFRAFIGGTAACFMTACIAGALIQD